MIYLNNIFDKKPCKFSKNWKAC